MEATDAVLSVHELSAGFQTDDGYVEVLDKVSFDLAPGQTLGLVGESGCGKSITALSIMRLLPQPAGRITGGEVLYKGRNLLTLPVKDMQAIRGRRIAMIFQEPMTALNPVHRIGRQVSEVYNLHFPQMDKDAVRKASLGMLEKVGIPAPEKRFYEYPHQLSGGMRQRVMIAMALACKPDILIADEPTTALDVTIQAQILSLMQDLQREIGMSIILITHDLGVVAQMCDEVVVMYAGRAVEEAEVHSLYRQPRHPYTRGLLDSIPRLEHGSKSELSVIRGVVPPLNRMPSGCRFRDRCDYAVNDCGRIIPPLEETDARHRAACIRWRELDL